MASSSFSATSRTELTTSSETYSDDTACRMAARMARRSTLVRRAYRGSEVDAPHPQVDELGPPPPPPPPYAPMRKHPRHRFRPVNLSVAGCPSVDRGSTTYTTTRGEDVPATEPSALSASNDELDTSRRRVGGTRPPPPPPSPSPVLTAPCRCWCWCWASFAMRFRIASRSASTRPVAARA